MEVPEPLWMGVNCATGGSVSVLRSRRASTSRQIAQADNRRCSTRQYRQEDASSGSINPYWIEMAAAIQQQR